MKKVVVGVVSVVFLLVAAALIVPMMIPVETYKSLALKEIGEKTGRKVEVAGAITLKVLPDPYIKLEGITVGNPEGMKGNLLKAKEVELGVKLMPLFDKKLEMTRVKLSSPQIALVESGASNNWSFGSGSKTESHEEKSGGGLAGLYIGKVEVENGELSVSSNDGKKTFIKNVNIVADAGDLKGKAALKGSLDYNGQKLSSYVIVDSLGKVMNSESSGLAANIEYGGAKVDFKGQASSKGDVLSAEGMLQVQASDMPELKGHNVKAEGSLHLQKSGDQIKFSMKDFSGDVDGLKSTGVLSGGTGGDKPIINAELAFEELDLNRFLPESARAEAAANDNSRIVWSDEKIDLSGLDAVDANVKIKASKLLFKKLEVNDFVASAQLENGSLTFSVPDTALFGGKVAAKGSATSGGKFGLNVNAAGVQAEPFLKTFADYKRLSGTMNSSVGVAATGRSQKVLVSSLSGNGSFEFTDGAIKGRNIAAMLRNVKTAFAEGASDEQKTDFSELRGTFQIASGVVHNSDLVLKSPLLRVSGAGDVNLPETYVRYRLTPELVASLEGQGATKDISGIKVPVIIEGDLSNPTWKPDLKSVVEEAIKNPESIQKAADKVKNLDVKDVKKDAGNLFKGLLGNKQ